jgi:hypothetical protein
MCEFRTLVTRADRTPLFQDLIIDFLVSGRPAAAVTMRLNKVLRGP